MIEKAIKKLILNKNLSFKEMYTVANEILEGKTSDVQIASFITSLTMKGETPTEITALVKTMREKAIKINVRDKKREFIADTCGTGGDKLSTFNVSTCTAFVVASGGIKVAKHGNRSVSSKCGSADILEALGVNIRLPPQKTAECIKKIGIGFLFAPFYHLCMKYVQGVRRELGFRSIFNIAGPLSNPALANIQIIGVYDKALIDTIVKVLKNIGVKRAFVVWSEPGVDEIFLSKRIYVGFLDGKKIKKMVLEPRDFGKKKIKIKDIQVNSLEESKRVFLDVLKAKRMPQRDVVEVNAGACLFLAKKAKSLKEGVELASDLIDSKKPLEILNRFIEFSQR